MRHEERVENGGTKLGGICSILIGVLNVLIVIYVVFTPAAQRYGAGEFFAYYAESPVPLTLAWVMFALTSVLAYALVPAVYDLLQSENRGWMRAASILAVVGYTVTAVSFLTLIGRAPELAKAYVTRDSATKAAIAAFGLPELDPNGWLMFGGVGVWILVVSVLGLCGGKLAKLHALIGIPLALCFWLTVIADVFVFEAFNLIAAGGGAILAPIWYIWMGIRLIRASSGPLGIPTTRAQV